MEIPSVRVLVVGDSGVGKTTLLRAVCRDPSAPRDAASAVQHRWTTGCDVHVLVRECKSAPIFCVFALLTCLLLGYMNLTLTVWLNPQLHRYREGYGAEKEVYIEFIDVGGHPKYEISRAMFYHDVQGASIKAPPRIHYGRCCIGDATPAGYACLPRRDIYA